MSDPRPGHEHYLRSNKETDVRELSELLAPLEETDPEVLKSHQSIKGDDTIVVDGGNIKLSSDLAEGDEKRAVRIEPVALALLIAMLLFIAFIAYESYKMPPLPADPAVRPER
jgi:hypothetical protein